MNFFISQLQKNFSDAWLFWLLFYPYCTKDTFNKLDKYWKIERQPADIMKTPITMDIQYSRNHFKILKF